MAKGNGGTRVTNTAPRERRPNVERALEEGLKRSMTNERESTIDALKQNISTGAVGNLVNSEIQRAIDRTDSALEEMEKVSNIKEVNEAGEKLGSKLRSVVARLSVEADRIEWNSNYATGRSIRTHQTAAGVLRQVAYEISQISERNYNNSNLAQLWEVYRSQNKWN